MTGIVDALYKRILLAAHPVGSIYQSTVETSPAELFGGTWEALSGRFLLGADETYTAGSTGGTAEETLTIDETPIHNHHFHVEGGSYPSISARESMKFSAYAFTQNPNQNASEVYDIVMNAGGGQPHNNMPPYLVVYMWKRTA